MASVACIQPPLCLHGLRDAAGQGLLPRADVRERPHAQERDAGSAAAGRLHASSLRVRGGVSGPQPQQQGCMARPPCAQQPSAGHAVALQRLPCGPGARAVAHIPEPPGLQAARIPQWHDAQDAARARRRAAGIEPWMCCLGGDPSRRCGTAPGLPATAEVVHHVHGGQRRRDLGAFPAGGPGRAGREVAHHQGPAPRLPMRPHGLLLPAEEWQGRRAPDMVHGGAAAIEDRQL
mmetsp:Transcript_58989/g.189724  ORF Transcript_58989/g.189724 Transcript_58989/m.189724 type:complete len:234 (+) Transcript_58989:207-908(+)